MTDEETVAEIRATCERTEVVLDPHTAVGVAAARRLEGEEPIVVAATAHPAKFADVVRTAIGHPVPLPATLAVAMRSPMRRERIAARIEALRERLAR